MPTTTATPEYSELLHRLVISELLTNLRNGLVHLPQGVVIYEGYVKGTDDTYTYGQLPDLAPALNVLAEGVTPTPDSIAPVGNTFSTTEYGRTVDGTDRLIRQQPYDWPGKVSELISHNAAESMDLAAKNIWQATHAGEITLGTGIAPLDTATVAKAVTALQERDVPPAINGLYVGIASPRQILALKSEVGERSWTDAVKYADTSALMSGHLGDWGGVRWVGNSSVDVTGAKAKAIIAGANALMFADIASVVTAMVVPSPGKELTDVLGQRFAAGWRARLGGAVLPRRRRQGDVTDVFSYIKVHTTAVDPTT